MLRRIDADPRDPNRQQVYQEGCDPVLDVGLLGVEVGQAHQPALGDVFAVVPVVDGALAVEIGGPEGHSGELERRAGFGEGVDQEGVSRSEVRRVVGAVVAGIQATATAAVLLDVCGVSVQLMKDRLDS